MSETRTVEVSGPLSGEAKRGKRRSNWGRKRRSSNHGFTALLSPASSRSADDAVDEEPNDAGGDAERVASREPEDWLGDTGSDDEDGAEDGADGADGADDADDVDDAGEGMP